MLKDGFKKPIPYFELYVSFLSTLLAIILLKDSSFLEVERGVYIVMSSVANQAIWSVSFAVAALLKIVGLVFKSNHMRQIGLTVSVIAHGTLSYCYFYTDGYLGASAFVLTASFSLISILDVKRTGLR